MYKISRKAMIQYEIWVLDDEGEGEGGYGRGTGTGTGGYSDSDWGAIVFQLGFPYQRIISKSVIHLIFDA